MYDRGSRFHGIKIFKIFVIRIKRMDKYQLFPIFFVLTDIYKQKCASAGVDIYYLAKKHGITMIPQNWEHHGIERPDHKMTADHIQNT